jgi:hypothetical protein
MTTRIISGYYAAGYALGPAYSTLTITAAGGVAGTGVVSGHVAGVANYGTVSANSASYGVTLDDGGWVTNGSAANHVALINGAIGVVAYKSARVINFATIGGAAATTAAGVYLKGGGTITNGTALDKGALIEGGWGILAYNAATTVTNFGSIVGSGHTAIIMRANGVVVNGSAADTGAEIYGGYNGIRVNAVCTVTNYGTIKGKDRGTITQPDSGIGAQGAGAQLHLVNGSASDVTALVEGYFGLTMSGGATAANFGTILAEGTAAGYGYGVIARGSQLTNGSATDATALIEGLVGLYCNGVTATNFGAIDGTGGVGVYLVSSSDRLVVEPGSSVIGMIKSTNAATLELAGGTGTVTGLGGVGTLSGASSGTFSGLGSLVIDAGADWTLAGASTVAATGHGVANYGTLGVDGTLTLIGALTNEPGSRVVVDADAVVTGGSLQGAGGTLELAGGSGTISALGGTGTLSGGASAVFTGFASYAIDAGASWTLPGKATLAAGESLTVGGTLVLTGGLADQGALSNAGVIDVTGTGPLTLAASGVVVTNAGTLEAGGAATLVIAGGAAVANAGGTLLAQSGTHLELEDDKITGGVVGSTGTGVAYINVAGGELDGTAAAVGLTGVVQINPGSNETVVGTLANAGMLDLSAGTSTADLIIGAAGASLTGGGQVNLTSAAGNRIYGAAAGDTLTNVSNRIVGAGLLGAGKLTLVNDAGGSIVGNQSLALTINTGTVAIMNAGVIENFGSGGTAVMSPVVNSGTLIADTTGTLTLAGAVSGAGIAQINGGTLYAKSAFSENVAFMGTTGVLELARSNGYAGVISGLNGAGTNSLDLLDIAFSASTKATYSGSTTAGVLTVTDGTHTAHIHLLGNYLGATFKVSSDGHGGTTVVDPAAPGAAPLAAAMSAWPSPASAARHGSLVWPTPQLPDLLTARA